MRKVKLGGKELELRASPLALLFYRQAFNKDLIADLAGLRSLQGLVEGDLSGLDSVLLLQIAYAMNRAARLEENFPNFEQWLDELENVDFGDATWLLAVMDEAIDGFFRSARAESHPAAQPKRKKRD